MAKSTKKKYNESENLLIKRSQINFAPYNPKSHTKKQIEEQKANIKRVGFLGGIVWNKTTGNLIDGHKRIEALDLVHGYDKTLETDYDVRVEMIELDQKTEAEQNVFMTAARTDFDDDLLRVLLMEEDIDYESAGLTEDDINYLGVEFNSDTSDEVVNDVEDFYEPVKQQKQIEKELTAEEKKENVLNTKKDIQEKAIEKVQNMDAYVTLSFITAQHKESFMQRFGFDQELKMISGDRLSEMVEKID